VVAAVSGAIRLAGTKWDIKPVNIKPRYSAWRLENLHSKALKRYGLDKEAPEAGH
jgi:hypothetical protein